MSRDGRLVFAATNERLLLFRLPLDANAGRTTGALHRIRDDMATIGRGGLSEDGRFLVFPRYEFGGGGVWIRELATGRERQLVATPRTPLNPVISADGRWVGYTVTKVNTGGTSGLGTGYAIAVASGAPRKICDDCQVWQWTRDDRQILITESGDTVLNRLDLATGMRTPIIMGASNIDRPLIAPNERWLVFNARERRGNENGATKVFVAPLYLDRPAPAEEWIAVHSRIGAERSAGLSPDGRILYLLLERDGFRCLYGQRVDPATGRPVGEPFLVHHFHEAARHWGSTGFGSATVTGTFLAQLFETNGNIWMTTIGSK
jgi:Tol biopolymer transport system component